MASNRPPLDHRTSGAAESRGFSAMQRTLTNLRLQRSSSGSSQTEDSPGKTRLGLTELHAPIDASADFVFIHGLRGGSIKTWRKYDDPDNFWPKAWIPADPELSMVRTSSFGYQSDWLSRRESILNVHDFGRKLLGEMQTAPFLRRPGNTPIVLIGHSMGGLVGKRAYLLARQESPELASRIRCMVFLATPHRGSDSADLLHSILDLAGRDKPYVNELKNNSPSLQLINDEFRYVADELLLYSFFEERKMRAGLRPDFVVGRESAILGHKHEKVFSLDANHREICKFESSEDENYLVLRNTLVTILHELVVADIEHEDDLALQMQAIESFLNTFEVPESELEDHRALKTQGSCEWIERRSEYEDWITVTNASANALLQHAPRLIRPSITAANTKSNCEVYWLTGKAGAGKSICSTHVITSLQERGYNCSYFFFHHGARDKNMLSSMLRSIALQMAYQHLEIRTSLQNINTSGINFDKDDVAAIWRQLFVNGILKTGLVPPQFWLLDALDECTNAEKLFPLFIKLECVFHLRIFVTSRPKPGFERGFHRLSTCMRVNMDQIRPEDTEEDIKLYLSSDEGRLDVDDEDERLTLERKILTKSEDCFLWVRLVRSELDSVYLEESVDTVLDELPPGMSALYERSLTNISKNVREKRLTQALLTWGVCSVRPLKLAELDLALKTDANLQVRDLRRSIEGLCGNLLYVDRNDCVRLVHPTVREFLFDEGLVSEFAVRRDVGHERLARACLKSMEEELRPPRSRSLGRSLAPKGPDRTVFASYAATSFAEHIAASSSTSDPLLMALAKFLNTTVLAWIEYIAAEEPSLYCLTRTAKNFKRYLERRAKRMSPLGAEFKLLQDWGTDLIRLVARFGTNLKAQPTSIYFLIPSIAPRESRLYQQNLNAPKWLQLVGPAAALWDDCVSSIEYRDTYATALACGNTCFAIGMKNGSVVLYDQSTCQERLSVQHRQYGENKEHESKVVKLLTFDSSDSMFASGGLRSICVWSSSGDLLNVFETQEPPITMLFPLSNAAVVAVTRSSRIARFKMSNDEEGMQLPPIQQRRRSSGFIGQKALQLPRQAPLAAAISADQTTLAFLYRGKPIYLYSLEDDTIISTCGRDVNSDLPNISVLTALFNPNVESNLLAVAYQDGVLALYNPWTQKELYSVYGDAYSLAVTPDGQTLGTGNTGGTVRLWEFETLSLLGVIRSGLEEVRSLAFTGDGVRLVDRRDTRIKVWEPSALVRRSVEEDASLSDATTLAPLEISPNEETITNTVICADELGSFVFAGRSDGSVAAFEIDKGTLAQMIYSPGNDMFVVAMDFREEALAIANSAQSVLAWECSSHQAMPLKPQLLLEIRLPEPIQQIILSSDGQRLLVTTVSSDSLWDLTTRQKIQQISYNADELRSDRRWASMGPSIASLLQGETLQLFDWESLERLETLQLANPLETGTRNNTSTIESFSITGAGSHIIAALIEHTVGQSRNHLVSWTNPFISDLSPPQEPLSPILHLLPKRVYSFLGAYNDRLVFLDPDLWICSIDLKEASSGNSSDVQKHIFVPPDFLGGPTAAKAIMTRQGHVVFTKEGQLAIIKGALDWTF